MTARIQTVRADTNPRYCALRSDFKRLTGCPVIVITSFNVRGEPVVCSPACAAGNAHLLKSAQNNRLKRTCSNALELD